MRKLIFPVMAAAALGCAIPAHAAPIGLSESGSTLLFPLFQAWSGDYKNIAPDVTLTSAATGSGAGTDAAIKGAVVIGASDAYLSDDVAGQNPNILDIPLAISAQMINYNIPGLTGGNLKLDGPALAGIYSGQITRWNDPAIQAMNPGIALPDKTIVPIRRADGSGDTFIFTQFLDFSADSWEDNPGFGTSINWPSVVGEQADTGNAGMIHALQNTPYSIGYVGISYAGDISKDNLGTAMIKNQAGKFLLPTPETMANAASELDPRTPPYERITLIFAPGADSYPLINFEYAVVSKAQPDAATAAALRGFLTWAISDTGGNASKYLGPVNFIALPDFIRALSETQIENIQ